MNNKLLGFVMLITFFSLINFSCTEKRNSKNAKIDEFISYCYENDLFNGAVLIAQEDEILYKNALGYSNFTSKEELNLNSVFCIGSISKQFTSMAVMILKEQGKLTYENKLSDFFPDYPNSDQISIRHLLNHTSGIPEWMDFSNFRVKSRPGDFIDDITNQDVFDFLVQLDSLDFNPGERYSYSNSGYMLLSMIIEKVSGKPFNEFVKQYIFAPLDMQNTMAWNKTKPNIPYKTTGYNDYGDKDDFNILTTGAGSIYSTIDDLYKYDQALYTNNLVSRATLKEAWTPGLLNDGTSILTSDSIWGYGFGWLLRNTDKYNIVWHDGGFNGFSAIFYRELNNHNVIILLSNKGTNGPLYPIQEAILNILNDKPFNYHQVPIGIKLKKLIDENGIAVAVQKYNVLKNKDANKYDFSINQLNNLGYYYLNNQKFEEAKVVLNLNIEMFPSDANVYDSYGEALMLNGEYELAIKNYKKSIELDPNNENGKQMLKYIEDKMEKE
ncbi:MAG: serine hydrolase [Candidatus Cloacimonetes bacterium]|nr:serine hydrolase [Candidatus Cloacimonadota bacterium]